MKITCKTPAVFVSPGMVLFQVKQEDVGKEIEAPEWVKNTLMYKILAGEGSILTGESEVTDEPASKEEPVTESEAPGEAKEPVSVVVKKTSRKKKDDAV